MPAPIDLPGLPPTDRLEVLRDFMAHTRIPLEIFPSDIARFRTRSRIVDLGGLGVQSTTGSAASIVRTTRLAEDETEPSLVVAVVESGTSSIRHHETATRLAPGDITAYWSLEPYAVTFEEDTVRHSYTFSLDSLGLPASVVRAKLGRRIGSGTPLGSIVAHHLAQLAATAHLLSSTEKTALEQPTMDLIRVLLLNEGAGAPADGPLGETLEARLMAHLELHFADPALTVGAVAHAHGISERYVQLLLSRRGTTLGEWVRTRRLAAAADALADPSKRFVTVSAIAARWGFSDHSHFTRAFRATYGVAPSQWRDAALRGSSVDRQPQHPSE
jgi:AraC-like DNA-binding protein